MITIICLDVLSFKLDGVVQEKFRNSNVSFTWLHEEEVLGIKINAGQESTLFGRPITCRDLLVRHNLGEGSSRHAEDVVTLRPESREIPHQSLLKIVLEIELLERDVVLALCHVRFIVDDESGFVNLINLHQVLGEEDTDRRGDEIGCSINILISQSLHLECLVGDIKVSLRLRAERGVR